MRSIRLSLILYFVMLLGLAMTFVLVIVNQTIYQSLAAKEESSYLLLQLQHQQYRLTLGQDFDHDLLRQAQSLVKPDPHPNLKQFSTFLLGTALAPQGGILLPLWIRDDVEEAFSFYLAFPPYREQRLYACGLTFGAGWTPYPELLLPGWIAQGTNEHLAYQVARWRHIKEELDRIAVRAEDARSKHYFQIFNDRGFPLANSGALIRRRELDPYWRDNLEFGKEYFDDAELEPGVPIRRVTVKLPLSGIPSKPSANGSPSEHNLRSGRAAGPASLAGLPSVIIQYARETRQRDEALESYQRNFRFEVDKLKDESASTLSSLRNLVLAIGVAVFAMAVLGAWGLIGLGLAPLERLSEAVSKVSERDFRLPFDPRKLSVELRPIYDRLTQTLDQLKDAFEHEKQACADISHELRTPLAALITTLEVGLRRQRTPEQYGQLLQDAHGIGKQMSQLVERLLALARIDAGADSVRCLEVDIADLAGQCVALVRPLAEARDLHLQLHCEGPAVVSTDPTKLREVFINLLHNAIEYNRDHGRVDVLIQRQNGETRVDVRDTGIGISPKALAHVFERFYRADESRQSDGVHAGVGLSIVKGYIDLIGASIVVNSTEGQGSTFTIHLPTD
jgi:signal transduction histidine kinase